MKIIIKAFIFNIILLASFQFSLSQTKEEAFKYFKDKLSKLESISFNFVSINDQNFKGYLVANKSNKFKLALPDKLLICDGESVWNYDLKQKQVVISDLGRTQSSSLQSIFFNITENYKPTNLQSAVGSKKKNYYILTLNSNNNPSENIELSYDDKYNITNIRFNIGKNNGNIKLSNMKFNPKTNNDTFKFNPPKDIEVIDLR